jgi:hypothetical protein
MLDQLGLDTKDNDAIQRQLSWGYQFNLDGYPAFQEHCRKYQPPPLVTWGAGVTAASTHQCNLGRPCALSPSQHSDLCRLR